MRKTAVTRTAGRRQGLAAWLPYRRLQEAPRVLCDALVAPFEMQVRTGGAAGRADCGDLAAAAHDLSDFDEQLGGMGIAGDEVVAMVDLDHLAVLTVIFGEHHHAAGCRKYGCPHIGDEIDTLVQGMLPGDGINAPPEARSVPARIDRRDCRHELFL